MQHRQSVYREIRVDHAGVRLLRHPCRAALMKAGAHPAPHVGCDVAGQILDRTRAVPPQVRVPLAMRPDDAKAWFGASPPDLSVEARARGKDWLYTYLRSFYRDNTRPTGWNNLVYENVSMPHVLWQLQGQRTAKFGDEVDEKTGETVHKFVGYQQVTPGTMSSVDYDSAVADLVSYLSWMSEPTQKTRKQLGVWVLLFLGVLSFFAWRLNAAYWKHIK